MDQEVVWTETATSDLESIVEYVLRDSEFYAISIAREIVAAASSLSTLAERGRTVPEYANPRIREIFVRRYRLIYRLTINRVEILRIIHGAREMPPTV